MNERLQAFVGARISEFRRKMAEVHQTMRRTATNVVVNVEARTEKFTRRMDRLANMIRTFDTIGRNTFQGIAISISSAVVPAVASLAGAIGSLGPMLGVVAGGAAGLGTSFGLAGAGAAAFGAVAVTNLQDVFKASEDIQKIQEKLSLEKDAKKRAKLLQEQAAIMANMNKEQVRAYQSMEKLRSVWKGITEPLEAKTVDIFAKSLDALSTILNYLKPTFTSATNAVDNLVDSLNQTLNTDDIRNFFDWMGKSVGPAMESLGKAGMNVLRGFMNLMVAFGPLSTNMQNGLLGMTERFAEWTSGIGKSKGFQNFINYVTTNGPKLLSIVGDISMGLIGMFTAFAPLSADMMTGIQNLTARFREWGETLSSNQQFQEFIGYVRDNAPIVIALIGEITRLILNLAIGLAPVGQAILGFLTPFLSWMNSMMEAHPLIGNIIAVLITLGGVLTALAPSIIAATSLFTGLGGTVVKISSMIIGAFLPAGMTTRTAFTLMGTSIKNFAVKAAAATWSVIVSMGKMSANMIKTAAIFVGRWALVGVQALLHAARVAAAWFIALGPVGWVIGTVIALVALIIANWGKIKSFTSKIWSGIWLFIKTSWIKITGFLKGINLVSIGKNIMQGLKNGIKSMGRAVLNTVTNIAGGIKDKITGALGIHSPSRWMRDMVGKNIGAGMIVGMDKMSSSVASTSNKLAQAAYVEPQRTQFAYDQSINSQINSGDLGRISNDINAEVEKFELPDQSIIVEMDGREVGRGVKQHVSEFQNVDEQRRVTFR
ncbi:phage tail protein [Bacillus gobiensis]|uniref:phage tail protein n=1 Tax=Bacillus gobiensis TaxID=1441095 RepID=UPI003D2545A2